jgi:hypothetical protein
MIIEGLVVVWTLGMQNGAAAGSGDPGQMERQDGGLIEASEEMLLQARRQKPEAIDPCRMLAQFYARRVTALHHLTETHKVAPPTSGPGEPDANGVYRVGGSTPPASRAS